MKKRNKVFLLAAIIFISFNTSSFAEEEDDTPSYFQPYYPPTYINPPHISEHQTIQEEILNKYKDIHIPKISRNNLNIRPNPYKSWQSSQPAYSTYRNVSVPPNTFAPQELYLNQPFLNTQNIEQEKIQKDPSSFLYIPQEDKIK